MPEFIKITDGKCGDVTAGRRFRFPKGSIVLTDKGYNHYAWYKQLNDKGINFVTRLKINAKYHVVKRHSALKNKGICSDQMIEFTGLKTAKKRPIRLRRIGYRDATTGKRYMFLTNNFKLSAKTIADIYKSRWQVELFFKWIKKNLKIKSFNGLRKNAVMTQIWVAMCVYPILVFLKLQSKSTKSSQQILRVLPLTLFAKRDLMALVRGDLLRHQSYNPNQLSLL